METPRDVTGPINLGNQQEFTIRELAERIIELTGARSRLKFLPLPHDDPRQRCPDISKAQKLLGWSPTVTLDEGLKKTVEYFDQLLSRGADRQTLTTE